MTKEDLAESLGHRLVEKCMRGELDIELPGSRISFLRNLKGTSDDAMITGYLKCSVCGQASISIQQAVRIADNCEAVDDWRKRLVGWEEFFGGCRHTSWRDTKAAVLIFNRNADFGSVLAKIRETVPKTPTLQEGPRRIDTKREIILRVFAFDISTIQREASAAGKKQCAAARALSAVSTPRPISAEAMRRAYCTSGISAWQQPRFPAQSPHLSSQKKKATPPEGSMRRRSGKDRLRHFSVLR